MQRKAVGRRGLLVFLVSLLLLAPCEEARAALPRDFQAFKARYQKEGQTPEGAVKLYFEAVFCYIDEATRDEGSKMLRYALHSSVPIERSRTLATFVDRLGDPDSHHIFRSFATGTSPGNNYRMSPDKFSIAVLEKTRGEDFLRLHLHSSGADSPRTVWMKEYDGLWYMINNAGTYAQVRPPKSALDRMKNAHDADYDRPTPSRQEGR